MPVVSQQSAPAKLQGAALLAARGGVAATALLAATLAAVTVPVRYGQLRTLAATGLGEGWTGAQAGAALAELGLPIGVYAASVSLLDCLFMLVFFAIAGIILWRKSDEGMALFVATFLLAFGVNWTIDADWWAATGWHVPIELLDYISWACFLGFFFLFPDGRFVPRRALVPAIAWLLANLVSDLLIRPPQLVVVLLWLVSLGICLAAQVYRYRRVSTPAQRQQTKWVVFGFGVPLALVVALLALGAVFPTLDQPGVPGLLYDIAGRLLTYGLFLAIPCSLFIAILYNRLWDIDLIINRALVYGALTACVIAIYVLIVGYLGTLLHASGNLVISLVATGLVAVLFEPLRAQFQGAVNRLMFGERDDPYAVLSRLGRRLDATITADAVLPTVVQTVRDALRLPYVAIALYEDDGLPTAIVHRPPSIVAATGTYVPDMVMLPLVCQGETVGELRLATRPGEQSFGAADMRLLSGLARQAGVALHAMRLASDLQRSRERLVTAREEERRRLRGELHHGLGMALAALGQQAGELREMAKHDPVAAGELMTSMRAGIRSAIADIRRLAYELRPPALDELGLLGALRERATALSEASDAGELQITVDAPDDLRPLPAAVEVAAFRIVQEALANVVRHARARACTVRLRADTRLRIEVVDDGVGVENAHPAAGFASMRERAAELGGQCVIEPATGGGTRIVAWLPLP